MEMEFQIPDVQNTAADMDPTVIEFFNGMIQYDHFAHVSYSHDNLNRVIKLDNYRVPPTAIGRHACSSSCRVLSIRSSDMTTQFIYLNWVLKNL